MTNRRKTDGFQGSSLGFSAIVCALACGSGDENKGSPSDAPGEKLAPARNVRGMPPAGDQLSPACDDTPLSTACAPEPGGTPPNRSSPGTSLLELAQGAG